jgi:hypothetical protein
VVGVLIDAATHAAGVVGENSSQGAGCDGGGIGADLCAIGKQRAIGAGADGSGLDANPAPFSSTWRSRKLRATSTSNPSEMDCPERLVPAARKVMGTSVSMAELEEPRNFLFIIRLHHGLRNEPVKAGIRGVSDEVDGTHEDAPLI